VKVSTTRFGVLEIEESGIILMKGGILGFEQLKEYVLICHDAKNPFLWLQSLQDGATAFVAINPFFIHPDYQPVLNDVILERLELKKPEDIALMVIVSIRSNPSLLTANLRAPIVINVSKKTACQVVLEDSSYSIQHDILKNRDSLSQGLTNFSADIKEYNKIPCCEISAVTP